MAGKRVRTVPGRVIDPTDARIAAGYVATGTIEGAGRFAGVSGETARRRMAAPEFGALVRDALQDADLGPTELAWLLADAARATRGVNIPAGPGRWERVTEPDWPVRMAALRLAFGATFKAEEATRKAPPAPALPPPLDPAEYENLSPRELLAWYARRKTGGA